MSAATVRRRPWLRRLATGVGALGGSVLLGAGGVWWAIQGDGNVHELQPGVVIRSAQPSARRRCCRG